MLQEIKKWLLTFPGWQGIPMHVEYTDAQPENLGLFSTGLQELQRKTDILGTVTVKNQWNFTLRWICAGQWSNEEPAQTLHRFQQWVQRQSFLGLAPQLGQDTGWRAGKGKLESASQTGTGVYTVGLTVEYTKMMEEENED